MNVNRKHTNSGPMKFYGRGMGLLDVVLAIAVFAFGMLALVQLQGNLTRSSADANTRTVAASIAEEMVEELRGYRSVLADPDNDAWDYMELQGNALNGTVTRGNIEYDRTVTVSHFWWDQENEFFVRTPTQDPLSLPDHMQLLVQPDFKLLRLDVAWGNSDNFYVRDAASADDANTADLGSGSVTVYEIIPSAPPSLGSQLLSSIELDRGPVVDYRPGEIPKIVRLQLDDEGKRFKESNTAQPTVMQDNNKGLLGETWFDVITYSQANPDDEEGVFLRREEFVAVSCKCTLNGTPQSSADYGLTPTLWNGASYTEGRPVPKHTGSPVGNVTQSAFCGVCCRDHHDVDGGTAEQVYNPENAGNSDAHEHYDFMQGLVGPVGATETYVDACRLVRKDGFMRVTHDVNQKTFIGFPDDYLDSPDGAPEYSAYVIDGIKEYFKNNNNNGSFPQPNPPNNASTYVVQGRQDTNPTFLPTAIDSRLQQMRARSVYVDYLTVAAKDVVTKCFSNPPAPDCGAPNAKTELEIYPFFELQMTHLAEWEDAIGNGLVNVASEGIKGVPEVDFDRGLVEIASDEGGLAKVTLSSEGTNIGLVVSNPIDQNTKPTSDNIWIEVNQSAEPKPPIGNLVSGSLSCTLCNRVSGASLTLESEAGICGKSLGALGWEWGCVVPSGGASLIVTGYELKNQTISICSSLPTTVEAGDPEKTIITLPDGGGQHDILITDGNCPPPP